MPEQLQRFFDRIRYPGITAKLFLAILAVCAATVIGMGVASRISFQSGFMDYLTEIEQERVSALARELAEEYRQTGNWDVLREPKNWRKLVYSFIRQENETLRSAKKAEMSSGPAKETSRKNKAKKKAPAPKRKDPQNAEQQSLPPALPEESPAERARRNWETAQLRSTLGLVEQDKRSLIAGIRPGPDAFWTPLEVNGVTIGWLTREPLSGITDAIDLRFQERQRSATLLISLIILALAAVAAMALARTVIAPLRRLTDTTNKLAAGDLAARVPLRDGAAGRQDELQILALQFNLLAGVLENNETARRTFMAEIAHDLRTPLAVLRAEIEAMEDGVRRVTPDALASLRSEVELLGRLVDDIRTLSLADIGMLTYDIRSLDLVACLRSAVNTLAERMLARNIKLESCLPGHPTIVRADSDRMLQIFRNIIENSLRYTNPGGCIQIRCGVEGNIAHVDILDSHPAVPEEQLSRLFERFHTGDTARSRTRSGSGLGLAICKTLIEAQGGTVSALPSPLGGLWVRVRLPLAAMEQPSADLMQIHDKI